MTIFDIDEGPNREIETSKKPEQHSTSSAYREAKREGRQFLRKENAQKIIADIGQLLPGESVDILTNGQSNAGGFYEVYRDQHKRIDILCVATWIINRYYIDMLADDLDSGRLGELVFIISNRMKDLGKGHAPNFNRMKVKFMERDVPFRIVNSHAKTYCFKAGDQHITVDGSGNWSDNPRIENYTISHSLEKFNFRYSWMNQLVNL